ncbi:aspartate aminotransferase family protein [Streptomyces sp. NPDC051018]|uniref:aspartate aminotransferase family protein n=1 Tax=Streptomyces sp. NPDC051018 TaxID=3365639 RepID=UPI003790EC21
MNRTSVTAFTKSRAWMDRAGTVIPTGATSAARLGVRPTPLVMAESDGARMRDIDGNSYLDFALANGPLLLGHRPQPVIEAVTAQMQAGMLYGAQHRLEAKLAEALTDVIPSAQAVCLSTTGSEAVHAALRFARAATGRRLVLRFEGHYHGWLSDIAYSGPGSAPAAPEADRTLPPVALSAGLGAAPDLLVARWNDTAGLERVLADHGSQIAALIMEPVPLAGVLEPAPGYLEQVRDLTRRHGIVLIFDEVVTGFRLGLSGAQGRYGVFPDLTVLGKALGAGIPISAVAGDHDILAMATGPAPHMGTFNGHPVAAAAACAALECYREPGFDTRLDELAGRLAQGLTELGRQHGLPVVTHQAGALVQTLFVPRGTELSDYAALVSATDRDRAAAFAEELLRRGVYLPPRNTWMLSAAHTDDDITTALECADAALGQLEENLV